MTAPRITHAPVSTTKAPEDEPVAARESGSVAVVVGVVPASVMHDGAEFTL